MSSPVTLPQGRSPLGYVNVAGTRVPVEIDMEWMRAFTDLIARTGGASGEGGPAVSGFEGMSQLLAGEVFGRRAQVQSDVRGDDYIDVTRDAQGARLALTPERLVAAVAPFLPRPTFDLLTANDSSESVLASQIFGA